MRRHGYCRSTALSLGEGSVLACTLLCTGRVGVTLLCVIPLLLLLACSGSGEGEDEDECLRASSTLSLLFDSNSRASCSFLLAFFSFLRRFWMEAVETQQGYFPSAPWHRRAGAVAVRTSALELGGELPFQTLPHLPLSIQLHLQLPLLRLDLLVLHAGVLHRHLQQALKQTPREFGSDPSRLLTAARDLTWMLVSRVSTDERPSANRKGAGNPGGRACPSGDSSVINTSFPR